MIHLVSITHPVTDSPLYLVTCVACLPWSIAILLCIHLAGGGSLPSRLGDSETLELGTLACRFACHCLRGIVLSIGIRYFAFWWLMVSLCIRVTERRPPLQRQFVTNTPILRIVYMFHHSGDPFLRLRLCPLLSVCPGLYEQVIP
jgi:hypothetical protein